MSLSMMTRSILASGALALFCAAPAVTAQQECTDIWSSCLDYCHYGLGAVGSGRGCKERCRQQMDQCRWGGGGGVYGYGPSYGGGRGYGAGPGYPPPGAAYPGYGYPGAYGGPPAYAIPGGSGEDTGSAPREHYPD